MVSSNKPFRSITETANIKTANIKTANIKTARDETASLQFSRILIHQNLDSKHNRIFIFEQIGLCNIRRVEIEMEPEKNSILVYLLVESICLKIVYFKARVIRN